MCITKLQIVASQLRNTDDVLKENVLCEFLASLYTSSFSLPPPPVSPRPQRGLVQFFIGDFFATLYLRLHQTITSKFSFVHYTTFVCLFVLQPNAKLSPAEMSLIEDHPPEPSLEILKLCTSVHREYKVRQHKSCLLACLFVYCFF